MPDRDTSTARPYTPPQRLRSDDELMAEALDILVVRLLQRPAIRTAVLDLIAEGVRRGRLNL